MPRSPTLTRKRRPSIATTAIHEFLPNAARSVILSPDPCLPLPRLAHQYTASGVPMTSRRAGKTRPMRSIPESAITETPNQAPAMELGRGCSSAIDDFGDAHTELVVDHHHVPTRDQGPVHKDVNRGACSLIQLDDTALLEPE